MRLGAVDVDDAEAVAKLVATGEFDRAGRRVVLFDPRGLGATTPQQKSRSEARWNDSFGADAQEAFLSLHLAKPLLGQRVADLLTILESLDASPTDDGSPQAGSPNPRPRGYHVEAGGIAGPIALHAAMLDEQGRITGLSLERSLISWQAVATTPINRKQLGQVVPGTLKVYDLPDLAASLAPRPLSIKAPVDPRGEPATAEAVDAAFAHCRASYGQTASSALRIEAKP